MKNIPDKVDGVDSLSGADYTSHKNEPLNVITASGQTPSASDSYQTAKAISMAAANGNYFYDNGTSSTVNYVHLQPRSGNVTPHQYEFGMQVRFMPSNANTSQTVILKVGTLAALYVSFDRETNPATYPPVCPIGTLDTSKFYTATYSLHPNGSNRYWSLNSIESADIAEGAITSREIGTSAVSSSKIATGSVTNDKMYGDLQLDKISGGDLVIDSGGDRVAFSKNNLKYGQVSEPNAEFNKDGIRFSGTGSPGNIEPYNRIATYNIKTQIAAGTTSLSDATTRTADSHSHRIGQQYTFASSFDTGIGNTDGVYGATMSYTELTTGRRILGVPVIITADEGSSTLEIISISIQNVKDAGVDYVIDSSQNVLLHIFIS